MSVNFTKYKMDEEEREIWTLENSSGIRSKVEENCQLCKKLIIAYNN